MDPTILAAVGTIYELLHVLLTTFRICYTYAMHYWRVGGFPDGVITCNFMYSNPRSLEAS